MAVVQKARSRAANYPPLAFAALAMVLLLAMMPSALNLPQSNPSQTLEYAPVPPEDESVDPPAGNFSSLGLGSSSGIAADAPGGEGNGAGGGEAPSGRALKAASTKRCVGNPPKQTEDPLSPPCVASFTGDNGGATYHGVTRDEITVLIYVTGTGCGSPPGYRQPAAAAGSSRDERNPCGEYNDLDEVPGDEEYVKSRMMRLYARYFNERYQTYGRHIRFIVYYSKGSTDEVQRAEAAEHVQKIKPFAVINFAGGRAAYLDTITKKGVMHFLGSGDSVLGGVHERFFEKYRGLVWGFEPTLQTRARAMVDWVCKQVVPFPVSFSGNAEKNGRPRKLGLIHLDGPFSQRVFPEMITYARLVKKGIEDCGGTFIAHRTHDGNCGFGGLCHPADTHEVENIAEFREKGVTTIIWAGGQENGHGRQASKFNYFPEIVVGGDGYNDLTLESQAQDPAFWRQAVAITAYRLNNPFTNTPCYQAAKEADPVAPTIDIKNYGCRFYDGVRQLVTGIQVAGPRLTPQSMEKGFRAIPEIRSPDPRVPACFYPAGGYSCVQDFATWWYDPTGDDPESTNTGCNRALQGGLRRLPGEFPREDIPTRRDPSNDPCNPTGQTI